MNPFSNDNTMLIPQGTALLASNDIVFDSKTNKIYIVSQKVDEEIKEIEDMSNPNVKDKKRKKIIKDIKETKELPSEREFKSEEFKLFADPEDDGNISDNSSVEMSCGDLEIDG